MAIEIVLGLEDKAGNETPVIIQRIGFLTDEGIFREAQDRAEKKYEGAKALLAPFYQKGVVQGSNIPYVVLINEIVRSQGLRTATPADIERTLRARDALGIEGRYFVDTGLVLRSERDTYKPNDPLCSDLYRQVRERLGDKLELPVMIPLDGLDLKLDSSNQYGLGFTLREDGKIIHAPILNQPGKFNTEDVDTERGLSKQIGSGNRNLYTRQNGLSKLYLDRDLDLDSSDGGLADSSSGGRVALCGEAARRKLGEVTKI